MYGADGRLQEEYRNGLDVKNNARDRATLLSAIGVPTKQPTAWPSTKYPTKFPTSSFPTRFPSRYPTKFPIATKFPVRVPTKFPSRRPSKFPTHFPTTKFPTIFPSRKPTKFPSREGEDDDEEHAACAFPCVHHAAERRLRDLREEVEALRAKNARQRARIVELERACGDDADEA